MPFVRYKFSSRKEYKTVAFNGIGISVGKCKREIMLLEKLDFLRDDLCLMDSQTSAEFKDEDELIKPNSAVVIMRMPKTVIRKQKIYVVEKKLERLVGPARKSYDQKNNEAKSSQASSSEKSATGSTEDKKTRKREFLPYEEVGKDCMPVELLCPICHQVFVDAVIIQCCGKNYCHECLRNELLQSKSRESPCCSLKDICPDSLVPNKNLHMIVEKYRARGRLMRKDRKDQLRDLVVSICATQPPTSARESTKAAYGSAITKTPALTTFVGGKYVVKTKAAKTESERKPAVPSDSRSAASKYFFTKCNTAAKSPYANSVPDSKRISQNILTSGDIVTKNKPMIKTKAHFADQPQPALTMFFAGKYIVRSKPAKAQPESKPNISSESKPSAPKSFFAKCIAAAKSPDTNSVSDPVMISQPIVKSEVIATEDKPMISTKPHCAAKPALATFVGGKYIVKSKRAKIEPVSTPSVSSDSKPSAPKSFFAKCIAAAKSPDTNYVPDSVCISQPIVKSEDIAPENKPMISTKSHCAAQPTADSSPTNSVNEVTAAVSTIHSAVKSEPIPMRAAFSNIQLRPEQWSTIVGALSTVASAAKTPFVSQSNRSGVQSPPSFPTNAQANVFKTRRDTLRELQHRDIDANKFDQRRFEQERLQENIPPPPQFRRFATCDRRPHPGATSRRVLGERAIPNHHAHYLNTRRPGVNHGYENGGQMHDGRRYYSSEQQNQWSRARRYNNHGVYRPYGGPCSAIAHQEESLRPPAKKPRRVY